MIRENKGEKLEELGQRITLDITDDNPGFAHTLFRQRE